MNKILLSFLASFIFILVSFVISTTSADAAACFTNKVCSGACTASFICGSGTGEQGCTYTGGSAGCSPAAAPPQQCSITKSCQPGYSCTFGACQPPACVYGNCNSPVGACPPSGQTSVTCYATNAPCSGAGSNQQTVSCTYNPPVCNWNCSGFGTCVNGLKTQTCTATNAPCVGGSPATTASCTSGPPPPTTCSVGSCDTTHATCAAGGESNGSGTCTGGICCQPAATTTCASPNSCVATASCTTGTTTDTCSAGNVCCKPAAAGPTCTAPTAQIQGFYSADGSFIIASKTQSGTCSPDLHLGIAGAIVVNAGQKTPAGTFQMDRTLCAGNTTNAAFTIEERPDMILNATNLFKVSNFLYTEVAP